MIWNKKRANNMEYHVEENSSLSILVGAVNSLICQGWKPQGGITILPRSNDVWRDRYVQAMVKEPAKVASREVLGDF